jgi:hypothetical protein
MLAVIEENSMAELENDDAFDENGLLKDGRSFRVGLMMRDHLTPLQRAIAAHSHASGRDTMLRDAIGSNTRPIVTDAIGDSSISLHSPGPRYLAPHIADSADMRTRLEARAQAYSLADAEAANAWQGGVQEGDACRVDGERGVLVKEGNDLVCRPHRSRDARDERAKAYAWRDEADCNAWRGPRDSGKWC